MDTTMTTDAAIEAADPQATYNLIRDAVRPYRIALANAVRDAIYDDDTAPIERAAAAIEDPNARAVAFGLAMAVCRASAGTIPADDDGLAMGAAAEAARQAVIKAWR